MHCSQLPACDSPKNLPDGLLRQFGDFIATHLGLYFPRTKWPALLRGVAAAAGDFGFDNPESCIRWILSSPLARAQTEILASHLTVGETYFLREYRSLEVFRDEILPGLIRARGEKERTLRIWSAGCSTGEEPYSLAILLHEMGAAIGDWNISLLATDINPLALRKAAAGVYGDWSFRNPPAGFREKYFRKTVDGRFALLPPIKAMVNFSFLNLAEDDYPSLLNDTNARDVIFCRNVLMYFTPERARTVIERLHRSLADGGWLIVSPCETSGQLFASFETVNFPEAVLFRKGAHPLRRLTPEPPFPPAAAAPRTRLTAPIQPLTAPPPLPLAGPAAVVPLAPPESSPFETAAALYRQGRYAEAEERLAALPPAERRAPKAIVLLSRVHANRGKLAEARQLLEQAIAADRLNAELHYLRAMILQEEGAFAEAATALKGAIYLDQELVLAHFSLANLALLRSDRNQARRHFRNTLALLDRYRQDETLPESEGLSAGRLREIIRSIDIMGESDETSKIRTH